jgi:hypothetical protein
MIAEFVALIDLLFFLLPDRITLLKSASWSLVTLEYSTTEYCIPSDSSALPMSGVNGDRLSTTSTGFR